MYTEPKPDARIAEYVAELSRPGIPYVSQSHYTLHNLNARYGHLVVEMLLDEHWAALRMWRARVRLTDFVIQQAADTARRVGFGYAPLLDAPASYNELRVAYALAAKYGCALPVYSGASSMTIYTTPIANWAFRFWHDVLHCEMNADFSTAGERRVASQQCRDCAEKFGSDSLEFRLLAADTIGQVEYYNTVGGFVEDQLKYVLDLLASGWVPK